MDKKNNLISDVRYLAKKLFPVCRSIMGEGVKETLLILKDFTNFRIEKVPSGTKCYDWIVPQEWDIYDAYIIDDSGEKIVDFKQNNLHVVSYSQPVDKIISFEELDKHLYTLPQLPKAIPYRTSYYNKDWGFCISYDRYKKLDRNGKYHIVVDSKFKSGNLLYGEDTVKGTSDQEFLFSTYCCHPSLANDNLSGMILWALLLSEIKKRKNFYSYRFVIAPETIGTIAYLSKHEKIMKRISGGFILTTVAGPGKFGYKQTFLGDHFIDRITDLVFKEFKIPYIKYTFDLYGSDERQFSSPYFRIPIGTISKDKYYEYDYYHTSLDNLDYIKLDNLLVLFKIYLKIIDYMEMNQVYKTIIDKCEPMLGKRSLYPNIGGEINPNTLNSLSINSERISKEDFDSIKWLIFYSDGKTDLLSISQLTNIPMITLHNNAILLVKKGLLEDCSSKAIKK